MCQMTKAAPARLLGRLKIHGGDVKMKRTIAALGTAVSLVLFVSMAFGPAALGQTAPAPAVKESPVASPKRVLFIGNSLVYYNGALQTHTHRIAAAANPPLQLRD